MSDDYKLTDKLHAIITSLAYLTGSIYISKELLQKIVNDLSQEELNIIEDLINNAYSLTTNELESRAHSDALCDWLNFNIYNTAHIITLDELIADGLAVPSGVTSDGKLIIELTDKGEEEAKKYT